MKLSLLTALLIVACGAGSVSAQTRALYPVVAHFGDELLEPVQKKNIRQQTPVRSNILGTAAVGTGVTVGQATVSMTPAKDDAKFLVTFKGTVTTRTVGQNRSALIYSRTVTPFECTREIEFDPQKGFIALAPQVRCRTELTYEGFDSTRRGPLGRLVRRIAERKAGESKELVRQLSERENRAGITRAFQQVVDDRLKEANRRTQFLNLLKTVFPNAKELQAKAITSDDSMHLAFYDRKDFPSTSELPTNRVTKSPIEIWIHPTTLGQSGDQLVTLLESAELPITAAMATMPMLAAFKPTKEDTWNLRLSNHWIVLSLNQDGDGKK